MNQKRGKTMKKWAILILSAGLAVSGFAQTTRTWDRDASTDDLLTAANWSGDAVPASTSAALAGRQDASWDGSVTGPLTLTYGAALGGSWGIGLVMTAGQTEALTLLNSAATKQTFRLVNSTTAANGGIQIASGAGAFTIGAAGSANPIGLYLGQGTTALNYYFANNSANTATIEENVIIEKGGSHSASLIFSAGDWNVKGVVHNLSGTANAGALTVTGGTVTLSGNNTGHFDVFVNGGILNFSAANNLGVGTDNIRIGQTTTTGKLVYNGASDVTISRQITIGNGASAGQTGGSIIDNNGVGVLTFDNAAFNSVGDVLAGVNRALTLGGANTGANTISGVIANNDDGNVSINKAGTGKWVLSGDNTLTGGVTVSEGTLVVGHANALGTGTINVKADTVGEVARLQSDGTDRTFANAVTFGGASAATANYLGGAGTGNLTFNGAVNWGSAEKTYTIDGSTVEFGGAWTGNSGTEINGIAGTDTATSIVIMNGDRGTAAKQIDINNNVTVRANHANSFGNNNTESLNILGANRDSVVELENDITLARTLTVQGRTTSAVALRNLSGNNSVAISVGSGGTDYNIESTAGNLTISGISGTADDQRNLFVTGAGNVTLANWAGRNDITKDGAGALTISGASTHTGETRVKAGELVVGNQLSLTSSTLNLDGADTGTITFNQSSTLGGLTGSRNLDMQTRQLNIGNNSANTTYSGVLSNGDLVKSGTGTLNLTGDNTFNGLTIWNGALEFDGNGSLGTQGVQTRIGRLSTSGTLRHTGASDTTVTGQIQVGFGAAALGSGTIESSGVGTLSFSNADFNIAEAAAATNRTLTLGGTNTGLNTISGAIVNNNDASAKIALTKTGAGTWVLDGANTYTGVTTVEGGKLVVDGSTAAGSAVTVNAGAILGGSGTIGGATTVNGELNPGNSPGTLTFDAALTLGAASTSRFEIVSLTSGGYDVLANDGGDIILFTDGSTIVFDASAYAGTANVGDIFQVLETWGGYSGTLANLTFAGTDLGGGKSLNTSMFLTDGTVSVIIPEPATIGMLGLGALITLLIRRQQQSIY